ncbi:MAG: DUF1064 domain-containing protein [Proteobacteria bacterium]|nr:DUF1064 domain-containing protein [Pseudomonadota bacterium]
MSKYGNRKTVVDGITFDSAKEGRRYRELKLFERAGQIRDLEMQKRFPIRVNDELVCSYIADFQYVEAHSGKTVVEDVKGMRTREYILKRKLMHAVHGITIKEV